MKCRERLSAVAVVTFVGTVSLDIGLRQYMAHNYDWIASMLIVGIALTGVLITIFKTPK